MSSSKRHKARSPYVARPATDRQEQFLAAIAELTEALGQAPSANAIAERLGVTPKGARQQLQALAAKGLAEDVPKVVSSGQWAIVKRP
jgi:predicted ArsR family transcriptional regulator